MGGGEGRRGRGEEGLERLEGLGGRRGRGEDPFEVSRGPAAEELLASPRTAVGC